MRRLSYLAMILVLLLLAPAAGAQSQDQGVVATPVPEVRSVFIHDNYFDPAGAVVKPGTTVLWSNQGSEPHTVTADDGSFDSGVLNPGDAFLVTFEGSGTLSYHCSLHPEMTGSVTVEGGAGEGVSAVQEETPPVEQTTAEQLPSAEETPPALPPAQEVPSAEEITTEEAPSTEDKPPSSHGP